MTVDLTGVAARMVRAQSRSPWYCGERIGTLVRRSEAAWLSRICAPSPAYVPTGGGVTSRDTSGAKRVQTVEGGRLQARPGWAAGASPYGADRRFP